MVVEYIKMYIYIGISTESIGADRASVHTDAQKWTSWLILQAKLVQSGPLNLY